MEKQLLFNSTKSNLCFASLASFTLTNGPLDLCTCRQHHNYRHLATFMELMTSSLAWKLYTGLPNWRLSDLALFQLSTFNCFMPLPKLHPQVLAVRLLRAETISFHSRAAQRQDCLSLMLGFQFSLQSDHVPARAFPSKISRKDLVIKFRFTTAWFVSLANSRPPQFASTIVKMARATYNQNELARCAPGREG